MQRNYSIYCKGKTVGTVELSRQGRFYTIRYRFLLDIDCKARLIAVCEGSERDLGCCGEQSGEIMLPIKRVGEGVLRFYLRQEDVFVPVEELKPFPRLREIIGSHFCVRSGVCGILIAEHSDCPYATEMN